jgi:hypothetical protein
MCPYGTFLADLPIADHYRPISDGTPCMSPNAIPNAQAMSITLKCNAVFDTKIGLYFRYTTIGTCFWKKHQFGHVNPRFECFEHYWFGRPRGQGLRDSDVC